MTKQGILISGGLAVIVALLLGTATLLAHSRERVVHVQVKRFQYIPKEIVLKRGEPVVLELESLDVPHGFNAPDLALRSDVIPGQITKLRLVPQKTGHFLVHCDIFCGIGHEDLFGTIIVEE